MISIPFLVEIGGLFLISFLSNMTPFLGASYTLLATAELISEGFTTEGFLLVVLVTAAGAFLGKVVLYVGAKGFGRQLRGNKNVKLLGKWLEKKSQIFYVAVFVTAVLPVFPLDDYLYIGAGANSARLLPLFVVTFLAKIVKSAAEIILEYLGITKVIAPTGGFLGLSQLDLSLVLSGVFVVLGIVIYKLDWEKVLLRFQASDRKGELGGGGGRRAGDSSSDH